MRADRFVGLLQISSILTETKSCLAFTSRREAVSQWSELDNRLLPVRLWRQRN